METGDIIFIRSNSIISRIVRFFDKGRFSHVALAISNKRIIEAQYNIKIGTTTLDKYTDYEIVPMNLTNQQKEDLLKVLKKYKGKRYDYLLALSMSTNWIRVDNPNLFICTELDIEPLQDIGALDKYLKKMKPNEFYKYLKERLVENNE